MPQLSKLTKPLAFIVSVLAISLFLSYLVLAWTEPSANPPNPNVSTPLNIGSTGQSKSGGLILNTGGAPNGLIVQSGNVGIGTMVPGYKLDIAGDINFTGTLRQNGNPLSFGDQWVTSGNNIYNSNSGNVGIGTTTPGEKLEVNGNIKITGAGNVAVRRTLPVPYQDDGFGTETNVDDENIGTYAESQIGAGTKYLKYDLGSVKQIQIGAMVSSANPYSIIGVQVSPDGATWFGVASARATSGEASANGNYVGLARYIWVVHSYESNGAGRIGRVREISLFY